MKQIIADFVEYQNRCLLSENLQDFEKIYGEKALRNVTGKIIAFIARNDFPDIVLSKLPPIKVSKKSGIKELIKSMEDMVPELASIITVNTTNDTLEFSVDLDKNEKQEIISYVSENLERDDIIPQDR